MRFLNAITATAAATCLAAPAFAQQQQYTDQSWQQQQQQQHKQQQFGQQTPTTTIQGQLMDTRTIQLQGERDDHVLGKVRTDAGDTIVLDLGKAQDLRNVQLRSGQQIQAKGTAGRINDNPILVVHQLNADGRMIATRETGQFGQTGGQRVAQRGQMSDQTGGQRVAQRGQMSDQMGGQRVAQRGQMGGQMLGQTGNQVHITGNLVDYRTVQLRGEQQPHVIAKVRTQQGNLAVVDLGPVNELGRQQTQLQQGQFIEAAGTPGRINRQPIVVAHVFSTDGRATRISQRMRDMQTGMQQRTMRAGQRGLTVQRAPGQQDMLRVTAAMPDQVAVQGQLVDVRDVELQGLPGQHRLVKLRTPQGQTVIANLGTRDSFQRVNLQPGDDVVILGEPARINDRPVVFATRVAEVVNINPQFRAQRARFQQQQGIPQQGFWDQPRFQQQQQQQQFQQQRFQRGQQRGQQRFQQQYR